jgi:hypothetical protein
MVGQYASGLTITAEYNGGMAGAECVLRPAVLWHNGGFGSDSEAASRVAGRLWTALAVCRQQGRAARRACTIVASCTTGELNAYVYDKASGAVESDMMPAIGIMDHSTGATHELTNMNMTAMRDIHVGKSDVHFGEHLYLPDGTHTITVTVGQEQAVFKDVRVSGCGMT